MKRKKYQKLGKETLENKLELEKDQLELEKKLELGRRRFIKN